jgi:hypothetical protein
MRGLGKSVSGQALAAGGRECLSGAAGGKPGIGSRGGGRLFRATGPIPEEGSEKADPQQNRDREQPDGGFYPAPKKHIERQPQDRRQDREKMVQELLPKVN